MPTTVWYGRIVFGIIIIPVRLYAAARRDPVHFHDVYDPAAARNGQDRPSNLRQFPAQQPCENTPAYDEVERVRRAYVGADSGVLLDRRDILKGYDHDGRRIVFTPDEVKALRPQLSRNLEIKRFVKLDEIERTFFDAAYYLRPDKGAEKTYALLYGALREERKVAIGDLAMHQNEYAVAIRAGEHGLVVHTLFYEREVCLDQEYTADLSMVSENEMELARKLVDAQSAPFDPAELKSQFEARVLELVDRKSQMAPSPDSGAESPRSGRVVNIEEMLRKSLEGLPKKPPATDKGNRSPRKKHDERRTK